MSHFFRPGPGEPFEPAALVRGCIESGARALLLPADALPTAFFDLSTRLAGELLHALGKYRIRLAVVVPDPTVHSSSFQDFVREANRGTAYRFYASEDEAAAWLSES